MWREPVGVEPGANLQTNSCYLQGWERKRSSGKIQLVDYSAEANGRSPLDDSRTRVLITEKSYDNVLKERPIGGTTSQGMVFLASGVYV